MDDVDSRQVTTILAQLGRGDSEASANLLTLLYNELRALAGSYFRGQDPSHTLQPTALVHEVFIKLTAREQPSWESRAHFFAVAAKAMRQILANHAERKRAAKRGGGQARISLTGIARPPDLDTSIDLLELDDALAKLRDLSPEQAEIVEMRFLAGIDEREIAHVLGISARSVRRKWRMARAFLKCELDGGGMP